MSQTKLMTNVAEPFSSDNYQSSFILNNFFATTNSRVEILKFLVIRVSSPEAALLKIQCSSLAKRSCNSDFCLSKKLGLKSESIYLVCQFYRKIGPLFPISFFSGKLSLSTPLSSTSRSCNSTNSRNLLLIFQKISAI